MDQFFGLHRRFFPPEVGVRGSVARILRIVEDLLLRLRDQMELAVVKRRVFPRPRRHRIGQSPVRDRLSDFDSHRALLAVFPQILDKQRRLDRNGA